MFANLRRALGLIHVRETGNQISLSGIPGNVIQTAFYDIWNTNKLAENVFTHLGNSDASFNRFFAPDIVYMLEQMAYGSKHYRKNIRAIKKIIAGLYEHTWLKDTIEKKPDILHFGHLNELNVTLSDYQLKFMSIYNEMVPRYLLKGYLLGADPGTGKAQPLHAAIKVPGGWSTMGQMEIGTKVITPKGTTTTVTGVHPQGEVDMYRIRFRDGREVEACGDHLWKVHLHNEAKTGYWKILSTKEIIATQSYRDRRAYVPLIEAEDSAPLDLPIDPYVFGVILGDGCISHTKAITITHPDEHIKERVRARLPKDMRIGDKNCDLSYSLVGINGKGHNGYNSLVEKLCDFGLMGSKSFNKFIPEIYLHGSKQQRLDLLNGLLDTDGTADKSGSSSFCSASMDLARSVQYLVRSLGGMANITEKQTYYTYKGEKKPGLPAYQVNIRHKYPEELFTLPKKKERVSNTNQYAETLMLGIFSIEYIGKQEAQCISVADEDHLYVTTDFTVTHNTLMGLGLSLALEADIVVCVCPKNAVHRVWEGEIKARFKHPQKTWNSIDDGPVEHDTKYFICHFNALGRLITLLQQHHGHRVVILLDESHNLNEEESLQSQLFVRLCEITHTQHVIWSSGTPVKAVGREATPLFRTIDPFFDDDAQRRFKAIYGKSASRANDVLRARMGRVHYHVSASQVLEFTTVYKDVDVVLNNGMDYTLKAIRLDMVKYMKDRVAHYQSNMRHYVGLYEDALTIFEKTLTTREQHKDFDQYKRYVKMIRKHFDPKNMKDEAKFVNHYEKKVIIPALPSKELRDSFKDTRSIVKYYLLKVQGEALGRVLGRARAQVHVDMVLHGQWFVHEDGKRNPITLEEIIDYAEKKTLVFTSFIEAVDAVAEYTKQRGYSPLKVYGDTNSELPAIVSKFEKDEDANPLAATYLSLSTAVPLTMANNSVALNVPFRDYQYTQMVARTNRRGQDCQPYVWNVKLDTGDEPNISTRSHDILNWSRQQVGEILGTGLPEGVSVEGYDTSLEPLTQSNLKDPVTQDRIETTDNGFSLSGEWMGGYFTTPLNDDFSMEDFAEMMDYEDTWDRTRRPEPDQPYTTSWTNW